MNSRTASSGRTSADIAMAMYRECDLRANDSHREGDALDLVTLRIAANLARYGIDSLMRLASAQPKLPVRPIPATLPSQVRPVLQWVAAHVALHEIRSIVYTTPRFGKPRIDGHWIFLGGDRRNYAKLPLTATEQLSGKTADGSVDLWGRSDNLQVGITYGPGPSDHVLGYYGKVTKDNTHQYEAFRRLRLLVVPHRLT